MDREGGHKALLEAAEKLHLAGQCFLEREGERINLISVETDLIAGIEQTVAALALKFESE